MCLCTDRHGRLRARAHVFALCLRVCAQIFTKIFVVLHYSNISLSFKFHKDPISVAEIFEKN